MSLAGQAVTFILSQPALSLSKLPSKLEFELQGLLDRRQLLHGREKSLLFPLCLLLFLWPQAPTNPHSLLWILSYTVSVFTCSLPLVFLVIMYNLNSAVPSHIFQKKSAYVI